MYVIIMSLYAVVGLSSSLVINDDHNVRNLNIRLGQLSLPSRRGRKSSTSLSGWVKVGRVHLCRVAGNTV